MKRKRKGLLKRMLHIFLLLALAGILCFGAALGGVVWAEKHVPEPQGDYDAIIVLGAQVLPSGEPNLQLQLRLEKALAYWQEHPALIICCGGQGKNEPAPEGDIMRDWLIARGVPDTQAVSDPDSFDTKENILHAQALLPENAARVLLVTSDYHLPRALRIARDAGLDADGLGSPILPEYWVKNHFREVLAWGKYYLSRILPI